MEELLRFRHNAMNISGIGAFQGIKGSIRDGCKDVCFVRAVGTNSAYAEEIRKLDEALLGGMDNREGYYWRINELPRLQSPEDVAFYSDCYSRWKESGSREMTTKATQKNKLLAAILGRACSAVEEIYTVQMNQATESIKKNLITKMLFWYDYLFHKDDFQWDEKSIVKIAAANIEKKQEYLFFYLVTLTGCDVLLLQSGRDIAQEEEKLGLSVKFVLGEFSEIKLPECKRQKTPLVVVQIPKRNRPGKTGTESREGVEKSFEELALLASSVVLIFIHDEKGKIIGSGSGIMIGKDGYILTNNHVARGGNYYSVKIEEDDTEYKTDEIIKYHSVLDLAIIRIPRKLNPLPIYRGTKKLVRGQKVVAIGSPLGLFNSVSDGIISGFRVINDVDMVQFTAPTSHGSSGGALLNMQGEVIGISTAGFSEGQNINLAMSYECINTFIRGFV